MNHSSGLSDYRIVADSRLHGSRPLFSVTVAVYNVEEYIASTLRSFRRQDIAPELVEYLIVDDGSTDGSVSIAEKFADRQPNVLVVAKPNGGVAETRKLALALARGEWVTAVDPDDLIRSNYFSEAQRFLKADPQQKISILSSRVFITDGSDGSYRDTHPLGAKFRAGNRVVSMLEEPEAIQMGATTFLRLDVLREHNLTFDTDIKPTFEDGNLVCRYLAHFEEPVVALLSTSHYFYRKRADSSSLVQSSWLRDERYTVVPERGYLGALTYAEKRLGYIPQWLANIILYDLMWYFKEDEKMGSAVASIDLSLKSAFMRAAEQVFSRLNCEQVLRQPLNKPAWRLRESLLRRFNLESSAARIFRWGKRSDGKRNYSLITSAGAHDICVYSAGQLLDVVPEGITNRIYFNEVFATEYSFCLPEAPTYFVVDGQYLTEVRHLPAARPAQTSDYLAGVTEQIRASTPAYTTWQKIRQRWLVAAGIQNVSLWGVARQKLRANFYRFFEGRKPDQNQQTREAVEYLISSGRAEQYRGAWLLLDHPDRADDNAEHLYRHLLHREKDINAYFMLQQTSPDWKRLEAEGFRLLDYGSVEAMAAARCADIVASSDAVEECIYPAPRNIFGAPSYQFVFLQHGITKDDISRWVNGKKIDLVVSSTVAEYESFVWLDSPYEYKYYNSAITGMPRYDSLYRRARTRGKKDGRAHSIFVMPTWRQELRNSIQNISDDQQRLGVLKESEFYKNWWSLLQDSRIQNLLTSGRICINFMVHPSFGNMLKNIDRPDGVQFLLPGESVFQDLIVDADIFLTDYSSLAFDCAYIGTPVAYYQFDRTAMFLGGHTYRRGYFDYFRDGLGPVFEGKDALVSWIIDTLDGGCVTERHYELRRRQTYRYIDDRNCARITEVMRSMVAGKWPDDDCEYISLPERSL